MVVMKILHQRVLTYQTQSFRVTRQINGPNLLFPHLVSTMVNNDSKLFLTYQLHKFVHLMRLQAFVIVVTEAMKHPSITLHALTSVKPL